MLPAETVAAGCGKKSIPKYPVGLMESIAVGPGGEYQWNPIEYRAQPPPDYSACAGGGGGPVAIQPIWIGRYDSAAFQLSSVPPVPGSDNTQARARKAAAAKILSTRI